MPAGVKSRNLRISNLIPLKISYICTHLQRAKRAKVSSVGQEAYCETVDRDIKSSALILIIHIELISGLKKFTKGERNPDPLGTRINKTPLCPEQLSAYYLYGNEDSCETANQWGRISSYRKGQHQAQGFCRLPVQMNFLKTINIS